MAENVGSSLFADRYRLGTPPDDWDTGRSGLTYPAFDMLENRKVVIKRADVTSPQADQHEHSLQNEAKALETLEELGVLNLGVPKLYGKGSAEYGTRRFTYLVMEYVEAKRTEIHLEELTAIDRAMILTELFRLLAKAHHRGVANGDVDLKHLFWSEQKKLTVIDWGNASFGTGNHQASQCAFDMARAAEIIYSLVTKKGIVPPTGPLDLSGAEIIPELAPLAEKYAPLCKWAPRNPSDGLAYSFTALGFYRVTLEWLRTVRPDYPATDSELDQITSTRPPSKISPSINYWIFLPVILLVLIGGGMLVRYTLLGRTFSTATVLPETTIVSATDTAATPASEAPTESPPVIPSNPNTVVVPTTPSVETDVPVITQQPKTYTPIMVFDQESSNPSCWEGNSYYRRDFDGVWEFLVNRKAANNISTTVDFSQCFTSPQERVHLIGFNAWLLRLRPGTELGFFIESSNGLRREYTLWTDVSDNTVYLKLRDVDGSEVNFRQFAILPKFQPAYPYDFYQYSIVMFLELDNQGLDMIYLSPGSNKAITSAELELASRKSIDRAARPSLSDVTKFGLISHGRDVQALLWPLVFSGK